MRTAVISDIHGNLEALLSVLEDIRYQNTDKIVSLGDNISYGADSEAVIQTLIARNIPSVLGNHEMAALHANVIDWYKGDTKKAVKIAIDSLSKDALAYIQASTSSLSDAGCLFVHGFPPDSCRVYLHQVGVEQLVSAFQAMSDRLCFVGHTHQRKVVCYDHQQIFFHPAARSMPLANNKKYIINVGSVGQPRDENTRATYVIWDSLSTLLDIRAVDYDTAAAAKKILAAGIPARFAARVHP